MNAYRSDGGAKPDEKLLATLYEIVEQTGGPEIEGNGSESMVQDRDPDREVLGESPVNGRNKAESTSSHGELSNRLRTGLSGTGDSGHLGERLKASAWDHIHSSLRYGREGKKDLAKMHADLAKEALQQASRHLADPDYLALNQSILDELRKLRSH